MLYTQPIHIITSQAKVVSFVFALTTLMFHINFGASIRVYIVFYLIDALLEEA